MEKNPKNSTRTNHSVSNREEESRTYLASDRLPEPGGASLGVNANEEEPILNLEPREEAHTLNPIEGKALEIVLDEGASISLNADNRLTITTSGMIKMSRMLKAPTDLDLDFSAENSIGFIYTASESLVEISYYEVHDELTGKLVQMIGADAEIGICEGLEPDTNYLLKMRAFSTGGVHSDFSAPLAVRTQPRSIDPVIANPNLMFPGAVGYAATGYIARNKPVVEVKASAAQTLTHSFLEAIGELRRAGGGTIVFGSSGVIDFGAKKTLRVNNIRIEGQTAPGSGVFFKGPTIFKGKDILVRHVGFFCVAKEGYIFDAAELRLPDDGEGGRVYMDHVAFWGGNDGNLDVANYHGGRITLSNCIFSSPVKGHRENYDHNFNSLIYGRDLNVSIYRSLFQYSRDRSPLSEASKLEVVNCIFDARSQRFIYLKNRSGNSTQSIIRNNLFYDIKMKNSGAKPIHIGKRGWQGDSFLFASNNAWNNFGGEMKAYNNEKNLVSGIDNVKTVSMDGALQELGKLDPQTLPEILEPQLGPNPKRRIELFSKFIEQIGTNRKTADMHTIDGYKGNLMDVKAITTPVYHKTPLAIPKTPHKLRANGFTELENWLESFA